MHQYYLYQHTRLDTGEVFYIGIGKKVEHRIKGPKTEFERAYSRTKRSDFWKNIASKIEIKVEILFESDDLVYIKNKEIELIKKYGRRAYDPGGTLVNFDVGGGLNTCPKKRGVAINQLTIKGILVKTWEELSSIEKELGWLKTNIVKCCRGKQLTAYGYKWSYSKGPIYKFTTSARKKNTNRCVGIKATHKISLEEMEFRTVDECASYFGMHRTSVHRYLNKGKLHKTHTIEYKKWL
jgi:hypothetical protein